VLRVTVLIRIYVSANFNSVSDFLYIDYKYILKFEVLIGKIGASHRRAGNIALHEARDSVIVFCVVLLRIVLVCLGHITLTSEYRTLCIK
jgi:hypothetical protein